MTGAMKEGETVVFGPTKPPTTDWRWQEVLSMEPLSVMSELRELDENLFAARSELKEAVRELAELEDVLDNAMQEALEALRNDDLFKHLFKGGTKDERAQRQKMHLIGLDWVAETEVEIKVARERKDNAQVAFDSLLDRQTNLGRFANMYAATARLLASIQVAVTVPPDQELAETMASLQRMDPKALRVAFDGLAAQLFPAGSSITGDEGGIPVDVRAIFQFAERAKEEIMPPPLHALCADVRSWMEWHKNPMGSPPVDTVELVDRVVVAGVEKRKVVAEATVKTVLEDEILDAMETAGIEIPVPDSQEVEIPVSMEVSPDDAEALEAAIRRHGGEVQEEESDDEVISL